MKKALLLALALAVIPVTVDAQVLDLEQMRTLAALGNAGAQHNLGLMYSFGEGVPEDDAEGVRWYRLAAEQGFADSQYYLGGMYHNGEGVPQDDAEAVRWWRLAADQGHAEAQYNLGLMYDDGEGVTQDPDDRRFSLIDPAIARLYEQACEGGFRPACADGFGMGVMIFFVLIGFFLFGAKRQRTLSDAGSVRKGMSPQLGPASPEADEVKILEARALLGQRLVLVVIAVILGLTLYGIIAYNLVVGSNRLSPQLWRFFLWIGLCVFLYRGANWARWVASVLFILNGGLLFTLSAAVPNRLEMVWTGWVFIVSGAVLLFVPSVRLYFRTRGPSAP